MYSTKKLDRLDVKILSTLQLNARITNVELAEKIGLSASPCLKRVKQLEKQGYIKHYGAQLDIEKLLTPTTVFTEITLTRHEASHFSFFERRIKEIDELVECHLISGGYDYLAKFICASVAHYQSIITSLLESDLQIEKYFSYIVIKSPIIKHAIPLEKFLK